MSDMTAERVLARVVTGEGRWSGRARQLATAAIADTLAIGLAGMTESQTVQAARTIASTTYTPSATLWFGSTRHAVADAAFVTGVACHSLDWDDYMHPMHGHCSAVLLATAWPVVASRGGTSADLLDVFLAGYQVDYLASLVFGTAHYSRGWHATSTVGVLGAAAAAARAMGLNEQQAEATLGIAASLASGLRVNFGTPTKALHGGAAARHGVQAAQLAAAGITASPNWLTGRYGMVETFGAEATAAQAADLMTAVTAGLHGIETDWGLVQKPYSCCGSCHAAVEAVIQLADGLTEAIDRIEVHVDPIVPSIMRETRPHDPYSARYSLTWAVAAAALDGAAGPAQFSNAALKREDIHRLRERVEVRPDLPTSDHDRFAARVVVHSGGRAVEREIRHAHGHPSNPMPADRQRRKQLDALIPVMGAEAAHDLLTVLANLDAPTPLADIEAQLRSSARRDPAS